MKINIGQWVGVKGLTITHKQYSTSVFCKALIAIKAKVYSKRFTPPFGRYTLKELLFSVKRNQRMAVLEWHTDITLLGFTLQIEKHKLEKQHETIMIDLTMNEIERLKEGYTIKTQYPWLLLSGRSNW